MNKLKNIICMVVFITCTLTLTSCGLISFISPSKSPADPIVPVESNAQKSAAAITLYFKFADQELLAGQAYDLDIPVGKRVEEVVVSELIKGPSAQAVDLSFCINPNTEVLAVSSSADTIFITLSEDFIRPYNVSGDVADNADMQEQAAMNQRLAVYSIADTITEMGEYSRVQLLVENDGTRGRITRGQAGFTDNPDQLLEPLTRNTDVLLTPNKSVELLLKALGKKDWQQMYTLIASQDIAGETKPSFTDVQSEMTDFSGNLEDYAIKGYNISADGRVVLISVDCEIRMKSGQIISVRDVPLRLVMDNGTWKVMYSSLKTMIAER